MRFGEDRTLSDQREGLNLDLHIIRIARPRYQFIQKLTSTLPNLGSRISIRVGAV